MKKTIVFGFSILCLIMSCARNPFTGKNTMALVPDSQIFPTAFQQYNQFLSENKVIKGTTDAKRVENVGMKIKTAAERWLNANGNSTYLKNYAWEYHLVDSKEVNAWCMPGGKIVVYTGILPITKDEAGMAAVMGHEVAHALANHGQQRMSAGLLQQAGAIGVAIATSSKSQQQQAEFMQYYGLASQVGGMLPFSRTHESEADQIGLLLMAIAGYNPENAVYVWERMSAKAGGQAPPEFMSTHPSNETRITNLKQWIPNVKIEAAKFGVVFK
ncbi:M48 family metallopeptidase [Flavobacterium columnare]|uniref:M48 family metallopeptidase n=1 Tax=Flavobacterium columnare TaxID=996 RepID=A0AAI8CFK7_9FLAO|nr:M48 family metallopeptidase [Flavobacterium columnare]AMO19261.1 M48 family metallopeptidase [Flavobacterium columnare]AUX17197.1 peptidase M48 [Flavobacterium columnare]QOG56209.1 M48 family metallopeptidase [Flavobacterium columnare]QOG58932.1 M48 family metallopeptidase [Flavobacterium columnare]QOG61654.1 M48 family metallopeptidase [Flavobacterium columnare]